MNRWTSSEIDFLKNNYPLLGERRCSELINRSMHAINHKAMRLKLKILPIVNFDASKVQTPQGAYLLGFLWADGNLRKKRLDVRCNIVESDANNIKDIFLFTGKWNIKPLIMRRGENQTIFSIWDKWFHELLESLDFHDKSVLSPSKIFSFLPEYLHNYFWRGYFDGDGCVFLKQENEYRISKCISFTGNIIQDWTDLKILLEKLEIKYRYAQVISYSGRTSRISITRYDGIKKLYEYLYHDNIFGLFRKYTKFKFIVDRGKNKGGVKSKK